MYKKETGHGQWLRMWTKALREAKESQWPPSGGRAGLGCLMAGTVPALGDAVFSDWDTLPWSGGLRGRRCYRDAGSCSPAVACAGVGGRGAMALGLSGLLAKGSSLLPGKPP